MASGSTNVSGNICFDASLFAAGTYHLDISRSGYTSYSSNFTYSGSGSFAVGGTIYVNTSGYVFHITGCTGADLPGATITINGSSYTTDANGKVFLSLPDGTYTYTISKARFVSTTDSFTAVHCGGQNPVLRSISGAVANIGGAAPGYQCFGSCNIPISETLNLSDGVLGAFTLTYDATSLGWVGSKTVSYPGTSGAFHSPCFGNTGTLCPASSGVTVQYGLSWDATVPPGHAVLVADYSPTSATNDCPHTDLGIGLKVTVCTLVSLTCDPFDAEWTHDACDCAIGGNGCGTTNVLWPGTSPIAVSLTE